MCLRTYVRMYDVSTYAMYVRMHACNHLRIYSFTHVCMYVYVCMYVRTYVCVFVCYVAMSVCLSVCLPACLPACLSVCLSVSVCIYVYLAKEICLHCFLILANTYARTALCIYVRKCLNYAHVLLFMFRTSAWPDSHVQVAVLGCFCHDLALMARASSRDQQAYPG